MPSPARQRLDRLWLGLFATILITAAAYFRTREVCATLAVDFRGYYASAQIALEQGFARTYDQEMQNAVQDALPLRCPQAAAAPPRLHVSIPYLPVFVLLFLPLTWTEFTTSYLLFSAFNLIALILYLVRFSVACGQRPGSLLLAEWMLCLPVLSNLALGQINVLLVVCLGEFTLATLQGKPLRSGLWLSGLLIKPYVLILLIAGLVVSLRWRSLAGFGAGLLIVSASSMLLAGPQGIAASIDLALRFAGPLIQTGPAMMNWRALALNLGTVLPGDATWGIAGLGMLAVTFVTLHRWRTRGQENSADFLLLILATLCATFALSWHSHFYLMMLLLPVLLVLDGQGRLPASFLAAWSFGLPTLYLAAVQFMPELARNVLGLGYLALNLWWLAWAIHSLRSRPSPRPLAPV